MVSDTLGNPCAGGVMGGAGLFLTGWQDLQDEQDQNAGGGRWDAGAGCGVLAVFNMQALHRIPRRV